MKACVVTQGFNGDGSYTSEVMQKLHQRIESMKRITKINLTIEQFQYLMMFTDQVNSCGEFDMSLDGISFTDMRFPKCLDFLIFPSKVGMDSSTRSGDLVRRPARSDVEYDAGELARICEAIYGSQKRGGEYVTVSELRTPKLLTDVSWCAPVNFGDGDRIEMLFLADSSYRWPIPLKPCVADCFGTRYFNESAALDMDEFINCWRIQINT